LARRGVALRAGLLVLMATARARAVPPRLVDAIRGAVRGPVPPTVADLAEGLAASGAIRTAALGTVLVIATAVVGLGLGEPRATTAGPASDKAMPAKAAPAGDATAVEVSGRV